MENQKHKIVFITSYPPRECGIATFSKDLTSALNRLYGATFDIVVCALENGSVVRDYSNVVQYQLDVNDPDDIGRIAKQLNEDANVAGVCLQHEFGLFSGKYGKSLLDLLDELMKPLVTTFHTVLPNPDSELKTVVKQIVERSVKTVVMTSNARQLLVDHYLSDEDKIE
ncbi:MAG: hypothetical protein ABJG78_15910, partial [Cyclobacteriaceae bacterium]